jgi:hypothetical protein
MMVSRLSHPEIHMVQRIGWLRAAVLGANDGWFPPPASWWVLPQQGPVALKS